MVTSPTPQPEESPWTTGTVRAVWFFVVMILLGIVLWKMASPPGPKGRELSYSEFLSQVARNNVGELTIYLGEHTAEVRGTLREPQEKFRATIPKEAIPDLTKQLLAKGVTTNVREAPSGLWTTLLVNALPLILLVAFWIFMMQQMRRGRGSRM